MEKILIYSPYSEWYLHSYYDITVAQGLINRRSQVKIVCCDGTFSDCDQHWAACAPRTAQSCLNCMGMTKSIFNESGLKFDWLGGFLEEKDFSDIKIWVESLSIDELLLATIEGNPIGDWVSSSVNSHFRMKTLDFLDKTVENGFRSYLYSGGLAYTAAKRVISDFKPDALFTFNGRMFSHRVFLEVARLNGVRTLTHERGGQACSLSIRQNESCLSTNTFNHTWSQWKDVPLSNAQLRDVEKLMLDREGVNTGWKSFVNESDSIKVIKEKYKISPEKKIVNLFPSSDDEVAATKSWKPVMDQVEWIRQVVALFSKKNEFVLVVRMHPNLIGRAGTNQQFLDQIKLIADTVVGCENIIFIGPKDKVSSYDLVYASVANLTFFSTLTLESIFRKKPALICGGGLYYGLDCVTSLKHVDSLEESINKILESTVTKDQLRALYRFCYHRFVRTPLAFPLVEVVNVHHARLTYKNVEELREGEDKSLDAICNFLMKGEDVFDSPNTLSEYTEEDENVFIENKMNLNVAVKSAKYSVSVVVTCYNYAKYLRESVESIINQTYSDFEIIIVNDGSTDDSQQIAEAIVKENSEVEIKLINQANSGQPAISRNNGIKQAGGKYILCVDADDKLDKRMLERCVQVLDSNKDIAIAYTDRLDFDGVDEVVLAGEYNLDTLKYANHISYCSLYRREVWEDVGGYRENVRGCEDWDFWVAAGCHGYYGKRIPEALLQYRRHDTGLFQHALANFDEKKAKIVINNKSIYPVEDINKAELYLSRLSKGSESAQSNTSTYNQLVSVIITTFNRPELLVSAINSVLQQSYKNIQIIVVNDCGNDVKSVIDSLNYKSNIAYLSHEVNKGLSAARNTGLMHSEGDIVCYLDDDDLFLPGHIESVVKALSVGDVNFVYTGVEYVDEELVDGQRKVVSRRRPYEDISYSKELLHIQNYIPVNTWAHKKNILHLVGEFDESMTALEDWDFLLRVSRSCQIKQLKSVSVEVRIRNSNGEHMSHRERGKFVDLFKKLYKRYPIESDAINKKRAEQLSTLQEENESLSASADFDKRESKIAVILHLYYSDLWDEYNQALLGISKEFDLYLSIPKSNKNDLSAKILKSFPNAKIYELSNKGRDILPFLQIFKEIEPLDYKLILKLHTKKSPHPKGYKGIDEYGEKWREGSLVSLLGGQKRVNDIFDLFNLNPELGVFSPVDQLYPFKSTDINYQIVNQLLPGIDQETFDSKNYSYAGDSMFWFRPEALKKILQLDLTEENFEEELGQLDGTLAHGVERLFGVICQTSGYILTDRMPVRDDVVYQNWLDSKRESEQKQSNNFLVTHNESNLKVHCIIYVDNEDLSLLANTIDSFSAQSYENWHLSVVSFFSCPDEMFNEVEQLSWLQVSELSELNVILGTLNVESDWLAVIEAGDHLESHALASCVEFINNNIDAQVVYTDDDKVSLEGFYHSAQFKPDFNLDLLYSTDYTSGLVLFNTAVLNKIADIEFPSIFLTYDIILNYVDTFSEKVIAHKKNILLHRSENVDAIKNLQTDLRKKALSNHFTRNNIQADILGGYMEGDFKIEYCHKDQPKVSIIIPTKDQLPLLKACVESILDKTEYLDYEIIIIDNQSKEVETLDYFKVLQEKYSSQVRVIEYAKPYSYSAINNFAVQQAAGDYLVLLNNDTMVLQGDWLAGMLNHAMREDVGVVGVKLVFPDKTLQHAGVILGMGIHGVAEHPHIGISMELPGYMNRAAVTQSLSAVTAACLMVEKDLYLQVGGLDEDKFKILYNDVDLCLKVRETGKKVIWTPYVTLIHHGSSSLKKVKQDKKKTEQTQQEIDNMLEKWLPQLANDPAYNHNLSLKMTGYEIDTSMNLTWNIDSNTSPKVYSFPVDSSGVGQYRVRGPLGALAKAGKIQSSFANNWDSLVYPTPTEIERIQADILLGQNGFLEHMIKPWERYRKFNDVFMVCGLDDLVYMLPDQHPKKGEWPRNIRRKVKELFQLSDRIIVANEVLKEEFSKMTSDDIVVVPNYLENWRWLLLDLPEKKDTKKLRVGWAGGQEHVGDLQFILPVVKSLYKEVDWVFMGLCLDELKPYIKEVHGSVEFDCYPQKLADLNLDLAIAPLMHNKFNECKTNLRLLEFGIMSWPIVCSDILPYQNAPVTRVANNTNEWIRVIREKINEPDELLKEGAELRQWVVDNYMLDDHIDEWAIALLPS